MFLPGYCFPLVTRENPLRLPPPSFPETYTSPRCLTSPTAFASHTFTHTHTRCCCSLYSGDGRGIGEAAIFTVAGNKVVYSGWVCSFVEGDVHLTPLPSLLYGHSEATHNSNTLWLWRKCECGEGD